VDPNALGQVVGSIVFYAFVGLVAGLLWPRARKRRGFSFVAAAIAIVIALIVGAIGRS
jgi:hypothetical protein